MREEILRLERVTCREQGVLQLENFNLQIFQGEIMGLLAVNSHGLDTLLRLLRRNLPLERGYVYYRERQVSAWSSGIPDRAPQRIAVIEKRGALVSGMTVADNISVLRSSFKSRIIRPSLLRTQLAPVLEELHAGFSPDDYVDWLSPFQRFVVELLKAVLGGCRLIVLRELSTFISNADLSRLHDMIRGFAGKGISFLYIGYHFEELREICDRTALLMNGTIPKVLLKGGSPVLLRGALLSPGTGTDGQGRAVRSIGESRVSGGACQRRSGAGAQLLCPEGRVCSASGSEQQSPGGFSGAAHRRAPPEGRALQSGGGSFCALLHPKNSNSAGERAQIHAPEGDECAG